MQKPLLLSYAGCGTCKRAIKWLTERGLDFDLRAIVEAPPTREELARWVPSSQLPLRRWLNTSGQSYRALGKARVDALGEAELTLALSRDGKLVRRPVLVWGAKALVGFDEAAYGALLATAPRTSVP
jgi:arsenate reductase (glutaredoxin)